MVDVMERWFIDDFELTDGTVRDVEVRAGLYQTAPLVGDNGAVPNRSGEVWRAKRRGAVGFAVNMWIGTSGTRTNLERLYDDVIQAIGDGSRLPTWTRYLPSGEVRQTQAEVVTVLAPEPLGQRAMRLSIEARSPSGVWEATVDATEASAAGVASGTVFPLTAFTNGITAPMERLTFEIVGRATNPKVTDMSNGTGESFSYAGTVPAGSVLTVNSATWGITGTGFTAERGALTHTGARFLTMRTPTVRGFPRLRFEYTNGSAATRLRVTGRPTFAV